MSDHSEELGTNLFNEPEKVAIKKAPAKKAAKVSAVDRTWVVLEENSDVPPTGLALGVNGDHCLLLPGEPVHLPNKYIEVLDHAIISVPQIDGSQRVIGHRERHRFPYRLATSAEIEAATNKG